MASSRVVCFAVGGEGKLPAGGGGVGGAWLLTGDAGGGGKGGVPSGAGGGGAGRIPPGGGGAGGIPPGGGGAGGISPGAAEKPPAGGGGGCGSEPSVSLLDFFVFAFDFVFAARGCEPLFGGFEPPGGCEPLGDCEPPSKGGGGGGGGTPDISIFQSQMYAVNLIM